MPKIFLSYSSKDADDVHKLAQDIEAAGITVWIDHQEIEVGDSITSKIQEGLAESDYLGIWLTKDSIESGWVQREWQTKLHDETAKRKVMVLPLLRENIDLPQFLRDKKFADFRTNRDLGLRELLKTLQGERSEERTIGEYVHDFLGDLAGAAIPFPLHGSIEIIETLNRLPRSGKKIRLETYLPPIPVRSIYDHIISIAHSADCLFPIIQHGIRPQEKIELARCIAYHDLAEVLLGDIPAYTNLTDAKRSRARVFGERRLRKLPAGQPEKIANEFIAMFLDDRERECMMTVERIVADKMSRVRRFFLVLDKIDPIIAVWRYLHQFRNQLDPSAADFLKRMKDFFDNPTVKELAREYREDRNIEELVLTLQDKQLARQYYKDEHAIPEKLFGIDRDTFARLIQGARLLFAQDKKHRRNRGRALTAVLPDRHP